MTDPLDGVLPFLRPTVVDDAMARAVLASDVDAVDGTRTDEVATFVRNRIAGMPTTMRLGVRLIAVVVGMASAATGRRVDAAGPDALGPVVRFVDRHPLPGLGDYLRLIRSLALVRWYDDDRVSRR